MKKGQIDKEFMRKHGETKKKLKVSWAGYIKLLEEGLEKNDKHK